MKFFLVLFIVISGFKALAFESQFQYQTKAYYLSNKAHLWHSFNGYVDYAFFDGLNFIFDFDVFSLGDFNSLTPQKNISSYYLSQPMDLKWLDRKQASLEQFALHWNHEVGVLKVGLLPTYFGLGMVFEDQKKESLRRWKESINHLTLSYDFKYNNFIFNASGYSHVKHKALGYSLRVDYLGQGLGNYSLMYHIQSQTNPLVVPDKESVFSDVFSFFEEEDPFSQSPHSYNYGSVFEMKHLNFYGSYRLGTHLLECELSSLKTKPYLKDETPVETEAFGLLCQTQSSIKKYKTSVGMRFGMASLDDESTKNKDENFVFNKNYYISFLLSDVFFYENDYGLKHAQFYSGSYFLSSYVKTKWNSLFKTHLSVTYARPFNSVEKDSVFEVDFSTHWKAFKNVSFETLAGWLYKSDENFFGFKVSSTISF